MQQGKFCLKGKKKEFAMRVVKLWARFPREAVGKKNHSGEF